VAAKKKTVADIARARVLSQRRKKLNLTVFVPKEKSIKWRIAEFLHWAMKKYPHQVLTYEEITQAVFSLGRVPTAGSKSVKSVRGGISSGAKGLFERYKTSMITVRGVGARSSVDDADILRESVPKDAERHRQSGDKLIKTASLISPEALKAQLKGMSGDPNLKAEILELSKWFNESLGKYVKSLGRPATAAALLPPPPQ